MQFQLSFNLVTGNIAAALARAAPNVLTATIFNSPTNVTLVFSSPDSGIAPVVLRPELRPLEAKRAVSLFATGGV